MPLTLKGSWPATLSAGILLLSKARRLGIPISVQILEDSMPIIKGPALIRDSLLVGLGLTKSKTDNNLVVVPGDSCAPILLRLGEADWVFVDRSGKGYLDSTKTFMSLFHTHKEFVSLGLQAIAALRRLGVAIEPCVLDVLFAEHLDPILRFQLFLALGRVLSDKQGQSLSSVFLKNKSPTQSGVVQPEILKKVREWLQQVSTISEQHEVFAQQANQLVQQFEKITIHDLSLSLNSHLISIVRSIKQGLAAIDSNHDALTIMKRRFTFLGGGFTQKAENVITLPDVICPEEQISKWQWLCSQAHAGSAEVERLWLRITNPMQ